MIAFQSMRIAELSNMDGWVPHPFFSKGAGFDFWSMAAEVRTRTTPRAMLSTTDANSNHRARRAEAR